MTHTKLPWKVESGYLSNAENYIPLKSPWREDAWENSAEATLNAEFIARACNSHDDLVSALKKMLPVFRQLANYRAGIGERTDPELLGLFYSGEAALAKAQP